MLEEIGKPEHSVEILERETEREKNNVVISGIILK